MEVKKAKIGNALTSSAANHVVAVSEDIYDESKGRYQSDINKDVLNRLSVLQDRKIVKVVSSLPTNVTDEYKNVVILVPQSGGISGNYFTEYIWNDNRNEFEQIGSIQTSVDLSGYYDKNEVDQKFSNVETSQNELTAALADGSFLVGKASNANTAASVGEKGVNKASLDAEVTQMVTAVDNLTTANTISPLSANQGKVLKEAIDSINKKTGGASVSYDEENETIIVDNSGSGSTNPLRPLFLAVGAVYNDTGADIVDAYNAPWGEVNGVLEKITHKAGCYYLNGLGDITEEEMMNIYKCGRFVSHSQYSGANCRTNIPTDYHGGGGQRLQTMDLFYNNKTVEVVKLSKANVNYVGNLTNFVNSATTLKYVIGVLHLLSSNLVNSFTNASSLINIKFTNLGETNNVKSLSLANSPNISKESILYTIENASLKVSSTITLHPDAYARLDPDEDINKALDAKNANPGVAGCTISLVSA